MKTIRFSITNLGGGGAEKILINILKHLPRDEYQISLFLFEKNGIYLKCVPNDIAIQYFIDPAKFPKWVKLFYQILIKKFAFRLLMHFPSLVYKVCGVKYCDIDIAYIQDTTYLLKTNYAKKKLAWIHCDIKNTPFFTRGLKINLKYADKIICVSQDLNDELCNTFPEYSFKSINIQNPSELTEIQALAKIEEFKYNPRTIVSVGRLTRQKGFDVLIRAIKVLHDRNLNYSLKILGEGADFDQLQELICQLNLVDYIELLGFKSNPYKYMNAADLFVLSSRYEGFGQVLVEALCIGVPIVSTDCNAGPREILHDGECGLLVPVGDVEKLADGIELLMTDIKLREKFIARGLKRAQDFDVSQIMVKIKTLLAEV
ncbi:MAG: glycosyltransferase [Burkholderiales bacterium]|nr:glycosyltransferase [Burkholderiales bacterium]